MQRYGKIEISVGLFVVAGFAALAYLSLTLGGLTLREERYELSARFSSVGDLKQGDAVKLAGVSVGQVERISLAGYVAEVQLSVESSLALPDDTMASIQTSGLLGDAYVALSPGASEKSLAAGGKIARTEPAITISDLIAKYAFGSLEDEHEPQPSGAPEPIDLEGDLR